MATFREKSFTFAEIQKYYRVPLSSVEEKCYLNVGKNSVVKVHDQKPLHTWTLTHPHTFTAPIVYSNEALYCVMDNNVLLKWSVDEDNLTNAEKIEFQESVFAVIPVADEELVVVFNSGKYVVIDPINFTDLKSSELVFLEEHEELIWTDASVSATDIRIFCLAYNEKNKNYNIYSFAVHKEKKIASDICSYPVSNGISVIKSWCLNKHKSHILTVWSDGVISFPEISDPEDSNSLTLKDVDESTILAIDCIDATHIVVARSKAKENECILEIWDTKFHVLIARHVLKTPSIDSMQVASENSRIFLCVNKELTCIPFHVKCSTLAAATAGKFEVFKFQSVLWDIDRQKAEESSDVPEAMDVGEANQDPLDSLEIIAQKLLNQNSYFHKKIILESDLIKLLQLVIRYKKEGKSGKKTSKYNANIVLNVVFSASFNDLILIKYLKRIKLEEILIIIDLLLSYLNHTVDISPPHVTKNPTDLQIVNWACLLIQSHMEALLFSKDKKTRNLFRRLEKAVSVKMEEYEDYAGIQNYFTIIQKNVLPEKCSVGKYCIEIIDI